MISILYLIYFFIIKLVFSHAWMHSHAHNSVTIWIYVLSYGFNWPDVIAITLHPDFVRYWYKCLHSHHRWGFLTSVGEIMFLFHLVCQQEMFPAVCQHKDNWLNWMSDTSCFFLTPFFLPLSEPTVYLYTLKFTSGSNICFFSKYNHTF